MELAVSPRSQEVQEILEQCFLSTKVTAKVLFPDRFYLPFSNLHNKIFEALDNDDIQQVAIAAPRGFGKSSIVNLAYPAKKILFREKQFIVPVSSTASQAILQSENLKRELLSNPIIGKLFGPMKSDTFSKEQWITETGTMVFPRGSGQQVRGILYRNSRPDLIIVDDIEDSESVMNEESRRKLKEWFFADLMNSVNRNSKNWKIIVIGTMLHEDSLLANLVEDPNWHPILLELFDDNYKSNWKEFMSDEQVANLVESYRSQGLLDVLYKEYRNVVISKEDASFVSSYFKYYNEEDLPRDGETAVIVDPAKSVKFHSAESAIVGVTIDCSKNRIYVRDVDAGKYHPDELYNHVFSMISRLKADVLAVEVTSLNEFITYPLKNEISKRGINVQFVELHARGDKDDRIAALVPFYRMGYIYHNKTSCGALEAQLLSFPRSKRKDCMDALSYVVSLLEEGNRYFLSEDDILSGKALDSLLPPMPEDKEYEAYVMDFIRSDRWKYL